MSRETKNIAASVKAKLANLAKEKGEDLQFILMRYARERFLYRLSESDYREQFLVKGATLFAVWFDEPHRPTKDLDLLRRGSPDLEELREVFAEICSIAVDDGLLFNADTIRVEEIREGAAYEGARIRFDAMLGTARLPVQVDIGFGDAVTPEEIDQAIPTLLDQPVPSLKVYPKETVVAEKFEAMVKLGIANGRMKDFWDLHYLIREFPFEGKLQQSAIRATFKNRGTDVPTALPIALTDEFVTMPQVIERWNGFINRNRISIGTEFGEVVEHLRYFFEPIIIAENTEERFEKHWVDEKWR